MDDAPLFVGIGGSLPCVGAHASPAIANAYAVTAVIGPIRRELDAHRARHVAAARALASAHADAPTALRDLPAAAPAAPACSLPIRISDLRGRPAPLRLADLRGNDPQPETSRAVAA